MKKTISLALAVLMLFAFFTACGSGSSGSSASSGAASTSAQSSSADAVTPEVTVKIGSIVADDHPLTLGLTWLGERMKELSGGKIDYVMYSNGSLTPGDKEAIECVSSGVVDMTTTTSTWVKQYAGDKLIELGICEFPFMFETDDDFYDFMDHSEFGQNITSKIENELGIGVIGGVLQGRGCILLVKPAEKYGDLNGRKIRSTGTTNNALFVESLGATTVGVATSEVYSAIQQGTVDGSYSNVFTYYTNKQYEVAPNLLIMDVKLNYTYYLYNTDFYNSLSDELKGYFDQACSEYNEFVRPLFTSANDEVIETCRGICETVVVPEGENLQEWMHAVEDSWTGPIADMGYDLFLEAMGQMNREIPDQYKPENYTP